MTAPYVGVVGASAPSAAQRELARRVGRGLAGRGAILVCGGLGGVMEAACQGAAEAGGVTVGLLPGEERAEGNASLTVALSTGLGEMRNSLIVRSVDAVIGIGGGWGTLYELALARRAGTPLFLLDSWEVVRAASGAEELIGLPVADPEEAVRRALEAAGAG